MNFGFRIQQQRKRTRNNNYKGSTCISRGDSIIDYLNPLIVTNHVPERWVEKVLPVLERGEVNIDDVDILGANQIDQLRERRRNVLGQRNRNLLHGSILTAQFVFGNLAR